MRTSGATWWIVGAGLLLCSTAARADTPPVAPTPGLGDRDPLGTSGLEGLEEDLAAIRAAETEARSRPPPPVDGPLLSARPGTRELRHDVDVTFEGGLARIAIRIRLGNRGRNETPVVYRLPLPRPASEAEVTVCTGPASDGGPAPTACESRSTPPTRRDDDLLLVTLPSIPPAHDAVLSVAFTTRAPSRGGMREVVLPPRRGDLRTGPTFVVAHGDGSPVTVLDRPAEREPIEIEPWNPIRLRSEVVGGTTLVALERGICGASRCDALSIRRPRPALSPFALALLLDASPSVEGEARNRTTEVLETLRELALEGSTVRVSAFAEDEVATVPHPIPLRELDVRASIAATSTPLGGTTRPDLAIARRLAELPASHDERILVVGDGGFTASADSSELAVALRRAGRSVTYVDVGPRPARPSLRSFLREASARYVRVAEESALAVETGRRTRLADALREALATEDDVEVRVATRERGMLERTLAPGGELRIEGARPRDVRVRKARTRSVTSSEVRWIAPALAEGSTTASDEAGLGRDVPRETVQTMLRTQVIPIARGCFRDDRRGRGRYGVRAELEIRLAEREVVDVAVRGSMAEPLRDCLAGAVARLAVPRFAGAIRVRYPLRTLEAEEPATVELDEGLETRLRELFGPEPPIPASPADVEASTGR